MRRKLAFDFKEGYAPLDGRVMGTLRLVADRYQVSAKADNFVLGMDWSDVWGDWERFPALLVRVMLLVIGHDLADYPFVGCREDTLAALTHLFSERGKVGKLCPSRKEGISPGYVAFCAVRLLNAKDKDWIHTEPAAGLVQASVSPSILRLGKLETPFVVAEEIALALMLVGSDNLWGSVTGLRRPALVVKQDNREKKALLSSVARPTWEIGLPGREIFSEGNKQQLRRGSTPVDHRRVKRLFTALDDPDTHLFESVAELVMVQDWLRANRTKFVRVYFRPGGEHLVNCGAVLDWLFAETPSILAESAVRVG